MGQEEYLRGAKLTWKNYQALSAEWEHEHCEFCFHKFLDTQYSPSQAQTLADEPEAHDAAGYTNLADTNRPAGNWWICERCFADFHEEFAWTVVDTDPAAWPYRRPEPKRRPTAADYNEQQGSRTPDGRWLKRPD